ncbi:hypothetical protein HQ545_01510 [Candidatus Woesearchaeota archaeon]|nr:hypothetical protein [Candidatus Woesearchaeota archaeon]
MSHIKRGACITETNPDETETVLLSFEKEAIGYIEDELAQGYGLEQIRKRLLDEGFPAKIINAAVMFVEQNSKITPHVKQKEVKEETHVTRRFHIPILLVIGLIGFLVLIFFLTNIGGGEDKPLPEKIDIFLYDNLGLIPGEHKIGSSRQVYSRDEIIPAQLAEGILQTHSGNALIKNLEPSNAVRGFKKRATVFEIPGEGSKTLVEIRFQTERDVETLKIVESIPKSMATEGQVTLTQGGILAEKDPIIIFTFSDLKAGDAEKAVYVIEKSLSTLDTITLATEQKIKPALTRPAICGDGNCVLGETHITCCQDCGCLPGLVCERNTCVPGEKDECQNKLRCDDDDESTIDECSGTPKTCKNMPITDCVSGDDYCPAGCGYDSDNDCEDTGEEPTAVEEDLSGLNIIGQQESPKVVNVKVTPGAATIGQEVVIEAKVTDGNGKDDILNVWFEVLELAQSHGEIGDMNDDGSDGDAVAGDDVYTATRQIGNLYLEGYYHMKVLAKDRAGNQKRSQVTFRVVGEGTVQDCRDMDCMIDAAGGCSAARGSHTAVLDDGEVVETTDYIIDIIGSASQGCEFQLTIDEIELEYTNSAVSEMLADGMTQAEIDSDENIMNADMDEFEGDEGRCYFETDDLVNLLETWEDSELEMSAWDVADCDGEYFG